MSTENNEQIAEVDFIESAIKKFNILDQAIAGWSEKYMPLKIDGIKDKEGYEAVRSARLFVKAERIKIEKIADFLKADALKLTKAINTEEKRIIGLMSPIESHLQTEEDAYEAEKKRAKEEKERQEQLRFNQRNVALLSNGCAFNGDTYSIGEHSIMQSDIRFISEEAFEGFFEKVKAEHQKELDAKAEQERLQREEAEQLAEERKELEKMRAEQEKQRAEIQRQQDEIEAEKRRHEQEKRDHENKIQQAELQKQRDAELKKAQEESAKRAKAELLEKQRIEAERKAETERKAKAREARLEALKPVKQKLTDFANSIQAIEVPVLNDVEADAILLAAKGLLEKVVNYINEKKESL